MSNDKIAGVFVRLPLSDNEKMALTSGVKWEGDIEAGILAIGTPVTGCDIPVAAYTSQHALDILRLITPEWMKLENRNMQKIPEMKELYFLELIDYEYYYGECRVRLMPNASQFVPEYFN